MRPTHVVAVKPDSKEPPEAVPDYVWDALYEKSELTDSLASPYTPNETVCVATIAAIKRQVGIADNDRGAPSNASDLRNLMWMSYFQRQNIFTEPPSFDCSVGLAQMRPFRISLSQLNILCMDNIDIDLLPSLMNHSVVGLANVGESRLLNVPLKISQKSDIKLYVDLFSDVQCLAAAIITCIDMYTRELYLISPISLRKIIDEKINSIIIHPGFQLAKGLILSVPFPS